MAMGSRRGRDAGGPRSEWWAPRLSCCIKADGGGVCRAANYEIRKVRSLKKLVLGEREGGQCALSVNTPLAYSGSGLFVG